MNLPSPIQQLNSAFLTDANIELYVKRDDLIDSVISGNKWRKLKFNVEKFKADSHKTVLTFGGAYSNHIAATSELTERFSIPTIGIIRGDELNSESNETLRKAEENGMQLVFTTRQEYKLRDEKYYHEELRRRHGHIFIVPEGGRNYYGMLGCGEILTEIDFVPDAIITAAGTGTTAAGLLLSSSETKVFAVSALKGGEFLKDDIMNLLKEGGLSSEDIADKSELFELLTAYHFGGYGKFTSELIEFIKQFKNEHDILLDQVYTAKMMYAVYELIKLNYFKEGAKIVALHTGGLQGRSSIESLLM